MTPAQIATLRTSILEDTSLAAHVTAGNDAAIAATLNEASTTMVRGRMVNARQLMALLGPVAAATILDKLEAAAANSSPVKWAMRFMVDEGIDVGNTAVRATFDAMAGVVLTAEEVSALKSLAELPASRAEVLGLGVVSINHVAQALTLANGQRG